MPNQNKYTCQLCKGEFDACDTYEYRGFYFCQEHFNEGIKRVDEKRQLVMEVTEKAIHDQRVGEFVNNPQRYNLNNTATDGLPIMKVREPEIQTEYERGEL